MILKVKLFLFSMMTYFSSFTQDSLFIKNELGISKHISFLKIDSMFITINSKKVKIEQIASSFKELSDPNDEASICQARLFYTILNDTINDTLNYLFDLYLDEKHFEIYLPGDYILKGSSSKSRLFIQTYKGRFWFKGKYGYSFGTYIAITGPMRPVNSR